MIETRAVHKLRIALGTKTQTELAAELGIQQATLSRILAGLVPGVPTRTRLRDRLRITASDWTTVV